MVENSLYARALEREMLPEEAERDVVSTDGTLARLGAFSYTQERSSTYRIRCEQGKMRQYMWEGRTSLDIRRADCKRGRGRNDATCIRITFTITSGN